MSASRYASRKFVLASAGFAAGVVFFALKWMTADQWIGWNTWLTGMYLAGNVADQAVTK